MSQQTQLPDERTAFDTVATKVANAVFFHKCAAAGLTPRTEEEARLMLQGSYKIAALHEHETVKAAAEAQNPFAVVNKAADGLMDRFGMGNQRPAVKEAEFRQVSRAFAQDADVYNSILSLKAAEIARNQQLAAA